MFFDHEILSPFLFIILLSTSADFCGKPVKSLSLCVTRGHLNSGGFSLDDWNSHKPKIVLLSFKSKMK
jgi:hypothetical protein